MRTSAAMGRIGHSSWLEAQVARAMHMWAGCAGPYRPQHIRIYSTREQRAREQAYDDALRAAEKEARAASRRTRLRAGEASDLQQRLLAQFARFSATALDLPDEAIELLTSSFLPIGKALARWARQFDPTLTIDDITQACRNAWTACGLQPLLGKPVALTPSILGYSLLYPYSDNYLDSSDVSGAAKKHFSGRFRRRLRGENLAALSSREAALWNLVALIEDQYPRDRYPLVFECLLAIHQAQENSIAQVSRGRTAPSESAVLRIGCAKGGSSVLADACLARGWMNEEESRFAFEWGVLLQLGDDLQDLAQDRARGSVTLFSRAAAQHIDLDGLVSQLLQFSESVGDHMDALPHGDAVLKSLLRISWRSLILFAIAESHQFFSSAFLAETQRYSPFRFEFLRKRRSRLTARRGLYAGVFEALLQAEDRGKPAQSFCSPDVESGLRLPADPAIPFAPSVAEARE